MATGSAVLDFGTHPGTDMATVAVTGQTSILSGSKIEAQRAIVATTGGGVPANDHSTDEHLVEEFDVYAGNIVAGTGFTIYGVTRNNRLNGTWSIEWVWI